MTADDQDDELVGRVRHVLVERGVPPTAAHIADALGSLPGLRSDAQTLSAVRSITAATTGAGPLQILLDDPMVTDVLVHAGGVVWVDGGEGMRPAGLRLDGEAAVRRLATRLIAAGGRRLDNAQPFADATLPDGHRVHAVLPPVAVDGTCLSVRALRPEAYGLDSLERSGSLEPKMAGAVRALLSAGIAMVVTGATGAGKTTLLGAMLASLDPMLRIVVVEDTPEVRPAHPQCVRLGTRTANVEGAGGVSLRELVRQALRMRPDRLVLGEVRGAEVLDLLVALNTGHRGGLCTLHANRPAEVPARIEALAALGGVSKAAIHSLLAPALGAVVHLERSVDDGQRYVGAIGVFGTEPDGLVGCRPALVATPAGVQEREAYPRLVEILAPANADPPWA